MSEPTAEEAAEILDILEETHPGAKIYLDYDGPWQLLMATILAAQCTDERVNKVTPDLFARYPAPEALAKADAEEVQELIRSTGFYRRKTKSIQNASAALVEEHDGEVPDNVDELADLPGVGRKTANVVLGQAMGQEAIAVDTHVKRVSNRLGLVDKNNPDKIERQLCELIAEDRWTRATELLTTHGRTICTAKKPDCEECPVSHLCDYYQENKA